MDGRRGFLVLIFAMCIGFVASTATRCGPIGHLLDPNATTEEQRLDAAERARATAERVAREAAPFLPPPLNYVATGLGTLLGEFTRKTVARKIRKRRRGARKQAAAHGRSHPPA